MFPLASALTRSAGRAALGMVTPLYLGIAIAAAVIFGPQGMTAADAVEAMESSWPLRVALWSAWLAATTPAARALFETPSTFYLRALPAGRWRFQAIHAAHLLLLEFPWILLHARGAGPLDGLAAATTTAGAHALICARPSRTLEVAAGALLLSAVVHARAVEIPAGILAAFVGVRGAFLRAPERAARASRSVRGPAPVALAFSYAAAVWRRSPAAIAWGFAVTATGAAVAVLAARNNRIVAPASITAISLGTLAVSMALALGGVHRAIFAAQRATGWLLDSTATSGAVRVAATAGAAAVWGALFGALHGAAVALGLGADVPLSARLSVLGLGWGVTVAVLGSAVARRADRAPEKDRGALAVALAAVMAGATATAAGLFADLALAATAPVAFLLSAMQSERVVSERAERAERAERDRP